MRSAPRAIFILLLVSVFLITRHHRPWLRPIRPRPPTVVAAPDDPKEARGFHSRTWYGSDTDKNVDALLTRRNFLIVLDGSGSMAGSHCSGSLTKIVAAKQAIATFARKLKPEDNLGLCAFDSRGVTERAPLSLNRAAFNEALQDVRSDSNTPLGTAVALGYSLLQKQAIRHHH